jgi:hypothetical protein
MYFYPYAAPLPSTLAWAGDAVGAALMVAGLTAVALFVGCTWIATHRRVVRTVPMKISILPGRPQLPRVAA